MGWDATGVRVETSVTDTYEYRDFLTMAGDVVIGIDPKKRTVKVERAEYRGLTKDGATSKTATSGWTIVQRDRVDDSGQWRVTEEKTTLGSWEDV